MGVSPEEQAFAAEAMVLGLQEDAPIGFAVHDGELRFELVSDSLAAMNGRPAAEHLGRSVLDILPEPLGEEVEALLAQVRDSGEPCMGIEIDGTTAAAPDERRTWVASFYPMQLAAGRRVGVVVVDVTDRRRAQNALRESERVLSGAQQMARLGWWTWIPEPETVVYSPELLAIMGRDPALGGEPHRRDQLEFAERGEMESVRRDALTALAERKPFARLIRARDADGELRLLAARATVVYDDSGEPTGLHGFAQDITEVARAGERERIVAELGHAALEGLELDALMERAIEAVGGEIGVDGAAVLELAPSGIELIVRASRPPGAEAAVDRVPIEPGTIHAAVLSSGQPVVVQDTATDERFARTAVSKAAGSRSSMSVLIGGAGSPFGLLGVMSTRPGRFTSDDVSFLQAVANVLADAVERQAAGAEIAALSAARGRLVAQALDAEDRARRRMSDTLHDGALQDLLAAGHDLHALRGGEDDAEVAAVADRLLAIVRSLRDVMTAMHPTVLQAGGLEAALQAVAEQYGRSGGFTAHVDVDPDATGAVDDLLLSVARELLENAARHARASAVEVAVRNEQGWIVIEVADDGCGIEPGGSFEIAPAESGGTRVTARAPAVVPDRSARVSG